MPSTQVKSELEGAVLGVFLVRGPTTAYRVFVEFARSRSSHWKASAGAIYPVVRRLIGRKLLSKQSLSRGSRIRLLCRVTPAGRRALARWVGPPLAEGIQAVTYDPIRTRVNFLPVLPPRLRIKLLREAEGRLTEELGAMRSLAASQASAEEPWELFATLGAIEELRGRVRWVRAVLRRLP